MKVLAVVPDGNALDILRIHSEWNPELEWHIIGIRPNAAEEPGEWIESVAHLRIDDRKLIDRPPGPFPLDTFCQYERAYHEHRSPFIIHYWEYDPVIVEQGCSILQKQMTAMLPVDVIVTWGERGWYNEVAIDFAEAHGLPVCRLERAAFPGMLVADGTGLEQSRCDLSLWHSEDINEYRSSLGQYELEQLIQWLSVAIWQNIEPQERTTAGMVNKLLDGRPSIFVPMQVPFDTNMIFRANQQNNFTMLEHVAEKYPDHRVLVKMHPADRFSDKHNVAAYCADHGWEYTDCGSHALIEAVDKIVSINSQCIIEAWMHDTPVEILGQPAFDLPEEEDKEALLYTLRFAYYIEPWQLTERLRWISSRCA